MTLAVTDLGRDQYARRLVILVYGDPKVGKTTTLLNLIADADPKDPGSQRLYLLSADRGTKAVTLNPGRFRGKIAIWYPRGLREVRESCAEIGERVTKLMSRGVAPERIWIGLDTVTHLQAMLLAEARKIDVAAIGRRASRGESASSAHHDEYLRDATTRVDYNVNLGHMIELTEALSRLPVNVVYLALEKHAENELGKAVVRISVSGQSHDKIVGDADVVARMAIRDGRRTLICAPGSNFPAGDRTGRLAAMEPPDLGALRTKVLGELLQANPYTIGVPEAPSSGAGEAPK